MVIQMAEEQITYSKKSLINIKKDIALSSTSNTSVDKSEGIIKIINSGKVVYLYEYNTEKARDAEKLKFSCSLTDNNSDGNSLYNGNTHVNIIVQYYTEINGEYADGSIERFYLYPYFSNESKRKSIEIELSNSNKIKSIQVEYVSNNAGIVEFSGVKLKYSIDVSDAVAETVGFDISLLAVDWYPNGFKVSYNGVDGEDKFYWNSDENDELNGINVNNEKLIKFTNHSDLLD